MQHGSFDVSTKWLSTASWKLFYFLTHKEQYYKMIVLVIFWRKQDIKEEE